MSTLFRAYNNLESRVKTPLKNCNLPPKSPPSNLQSNAIKMPHNLISSNQEQKKMLERGRGVRISEIFDSNKNV